MTAIKEIPHLMIPLGDGRNLSARLWLPQNAEDQPVPAILEYLPYRKRDGTARRDEGNYPHLAAAGYAGLRVDLPGQGESDGLMRDEYSEDELAVGEEVIAWMAEQPWCNGNVGMIGISWGGFNGLQIAMRRPPALKAVISVCSTVDRYADDIHFMGGCLITDNITWSQQMLAYSTRLIDPILRDDWQSLWRYRLEHQPAYILNWLAHPTRDAYWKQGSVCEDWQAINAAVLAVGGWADAYKNAPLQLAENLHAPCAAWIGPWEHAYPDISRVGPVGDFLGEVKAWFDQYLKHIKPDQPAPMIRAYINSFQGSIGAWGNHPGRWIAEPKWPSPHIKERSLYLQTGRLGTIAGEGVMAVNTKQTVGLAAGNYCPGMRVERELPGDQRDDDLASVCFDMEPLVEDMEILGQARLEIGFTCDQKQANLVARICEVAPDGRSQRISYRPFNLCHHSSHETPENLVPGDHYTATIPLNYAGWRLRAGHHLRLALSTHYWPIIWPSPVAATLTLDLAKCRLVLPERRAGLAADHYTQPDDQQLCPAKMTPDANIWKNIAPAIGHFCDDLDEHGNLEIKTFDDFGHWQSSIHGLEHHMSVRQIFKINENNPLAAEVFAEWECMINRGDITAITRTSHHIKADETYFYLEINLDAELNKEPFFSKKWSEKILRQHQ